MKGIWRARNLLHRSEKSFSLKGANVENETHEHEKPKHRDRVKVVRMMSVVYGIKINEKVYFESGMKD